MDFLKTAFEGVLILQPKIFRDPRGLFLETYRKETYETMLRDDFVQDNLSYSKHGTLRGLHYQIKHPQAKLVQVIRGKIFDVIVDIRRGSPDFGRHMGIYLSGEAGEQLYIPAGFAHGFCVVSEEAYVLYKCSDYYCPEGERGLLWSDPDLNIEWPVKTPILSSKDTLYPCLKDIPDEELPRMKSVSISK
jgi:dTDP-4-dehydrorhamnose 3,5-epimerase